MWVVELGLELELELELECKNPTLPSDFFDKDGSNSLGEEGGRVMRWSWPARHFHLASLGRRRRASITA